MHPVTIEDCVRFHGHMCGGIAIGFAMSRFAMEQLGAQPGERLYCRAEFQNCMTDAVQCVTGCTAGKGNLEVYPIGKRALTLVRADTGRGVRVTADIEFPEGISREESAALVLAADPASFCRAAEATLKIPQKEQSGFVRCAVCGEEFSKSCARQVGGQLYCPDCAERAQ